MVTKTAETKLVSSSAQTEWMDVTPDMAREWLEHNPRNRVMRSRWVNKLVTIMQEGRWHETTDAIGFDINGDLINGQHRLAAIAESGVTCRLLVAHGLQPDAYEYIDRPIRRSTADSLHVAGENNTLVLSATLRLVARWETGVLGVYDKHKGAQETDELFEVLERHPEVREWVSNMARSVGYRKRPAVRRFYASAAVPAFCWYAFATRDNQMAYDFLQQVETGAGLDIGDPAYELRERLLDMRSRRGESDQIMNIALTIKAWNAYRQGRPVQVLSWKINESFPEIV